MSHQWTFNRTSLTMEKDETAIVTNRQWPSAIVLENVDRFCP